MNHTESFNLLADAHSIMPENQEIYRYMQIVIDDLPEGYEKSTLIKRRQDLFPYSIEDLT